MARSPECTGCCARKVIDTADIVRDVLTSTIALDSLYESEHFDVIRITVGDAKLILQWGSNQKHRDVARKILGGAPSSMFCGGLRD
jgi:hypothetical protein